MSVIATFFAVIQASPPPIAIAIIINSIFAIPGVKKVAAVANNIPPPAQTIPNLAVVGELILFRPRIKTIAAIR